MLGYFINVFVNGGYEDYSIFSVLGFVPTSDILVVVVIVGGVCGIADTTALDAIVVICEAWA